MNPDRLAKTFTVAELREFETLGVPLEVVAEFVHELDAESGVTLFALLESHVKHYTMKE